MTPGPYLQRKRAVIQGRMTALKVLGLRINLVLVRGCAA
jgi:hypothetical protein